MTSPRQPTSPKAGNELALIDLPKIEEKSSPTFLLPPEKYQEFYILCQQMNALVMSQKDNEAKLAQYEQDLDVLEAKTPTARGSVTTTDAAHTAQTLRVMFLNQNPKIKLTVTDKNKKQTEVALRVALNTTKEFLVSVKKQLKPLHDKLVKLNEEITRISGQSNFIEKQNAALIQSLLKHADKLKKENELDSPTNKKAKAMLRSKALEAIEAKRKNFNKVFSSLFEINDQFELTLLRNLFDLKELALLCKKLAALNIPFSGEKNQQRAATDNKKRLEDIEKFAAYQQKLIKQIDACNSDITTVGHKISSDKHQALLSDVSMHFGAAKNTAEVQLKALQSPAGAEEKRRPPTAEEKKEYADTVISKMIKMLKDNEQPYFSPKSSRHFQSRQSPKTTEEKALAVLEDDKETNPIEKLKTLARVLEIGLKGAKTKTDRDVNLENLDISRLQYIKLPFDQIFATLWIAANVANNPPANSSNDDLLLLAGTRLHEAAVRLVTTWKPNYMKRENFHFPEDELNPTPPDTEAGPSASSPRPASS